MKFGIVLTIVCAYYCSDKLQAEAQQQPGAPLKSNDQQHIQADVTVIHAPTRDAYDITAFVISIVLGVVGIGGVSVGVCTLVFLRKQASEMRHQRIIMRRTLNTMRLQTKTLSDSVAVAKKSADAAKENVDLLINKERGRMFVEVLPFDIKKVEVMTQVVEFKVIYHGATVSFHESSTADFMLTDSAEPPAFKAPSWLKTKAMFNIPSVIPANSDTFNCSTRLYRKFDQYEIDRIGHSQSFIHFYGYIEYKDFMDRIHVTSFCYTWKPRPPGPTIGWDHWDKSGPPDANLET